MRVARITNAVAQSETYSMRRWKRAALDLAALRHEAVMKLSGRFFLGG
jgi:hypothetical protein